MSIVNKLSNVLNHLNKPNNNNRRRNRKRRNFSTRAMPAAYASHVRPRFSLRRIKGGCTVSGCDLIYRIPDVINSQGDALFCIIPANPAYWKGTRIGRIASAYQTYRPMRFTVSYIPQVAVTQPGVVFMGTMWDMAPPSDNLQQSLLTSNGGQLTQCYIPADSTVMLGKCLQQNLFKISGALTSDTNPFIFCAGIAGAQLVPGYLYVTYSYELRNPIGDSWTFINSGRTTISAIPSQDNTSNGSVILLQQVGSLGPGTIIDSESNGLFYHGSPVTIPEETAVFYLNNFQTSTQTASRSLGYISQSTTQVIGLVNGILSKTVIPFDRFIRSNQFSFTDPTSVLILRRVNDNYQMANIRFDGPISLDYPGQEVYYYVGLGITTAYLVDSSVTPVFSIPINNPSTDPSQIELESYFLTVPSNFIISV